MCLKILEYIAQLDRRFKKKWDLWDEWETLSTGYFLATAVAFDILARRFLGMENAVAVPDHHWLRALRSTLGV